MSIVSIVLTSQKFHSLISTWMVWFFTCFSSRNLVNLRKRFPCLTHNWLYCASFSYHARTTLTVDGCRYSMYCHSEAGNSTIKVCRAKLAIKKWNLQKILKKKDEFWLSLRVVVLLKYEVWVWDVLKVQCQYTLI